MSDTPRTDEQLRIQCGSRAKSDIDIHFVRDLERELSRETRRLDWMLSASGEQLNALDQWDRDNIDDAIDREGVE